MKRGVVDRAPGRAWPGRAPARSSRCGGPCGWRPAPPPGGGGRRRARSASSPSISTADAVGAQQRGGGGEPVALLDPQLGEPVHAAWSRRRRRRRRRGSGIRRSCWARARAARRRRAGRNRRRRCRRPARRPRCARLVICRSAPISRSVSNRPVRAGLRPTPRTVTREPGTIRAATSAKAAEDGSPGTSTSAARNSGWPRRLDDPAGAEPARTTTCAPKCRSMRSVWSRVASGSSIRVQPRAFSPASSSADFTCAEATGRRYSIGSASPRAADGQRQAAALPAGECRARRRRAAR